MDCSCRKFLGLVFTKKSGNGIRITKIEIEKRKGKLAGLGHENPPAVFYLLNNSFSLSPFFVFLPSELVTFIRLSQLQIVLKYFCKLHEGRAKLILIKEDD